MSLIVSDVLRPRIEEVMSSCVNKEPSGYPTKQWILFHVKQDPQWLTTTSNGHTASRKRLWS